MYQAKFLVLGKCLLDNKPDSECDSDSDNHKGSLIG